MHTEKQRNIIRDYLLPVYQELEGRSILDIQSGAGHTVLILRPEPEDYTGLETSPELLREAAQELPPYVFLNIPYPSPITNGIKYDAVVYLMSRDDLINKVVALKRNAIKKGIIVVGIERQYMTSKQLMWHCDIGQLRGKVYGIDVWDRLPLWLDKIIGRLFPDLAKYLLFIGHHTHT